MSFLRRGLSLFLALILLLTCSPIQASAQDSQSQSQATVNGGNTSFESTNAIGDLITQDLNEELEQQNVATNSDYSITDLTVEDGLATVHCNALTDAIVIVGIYSEDGMQLLASGYASATPGDSNTVVTIEGDIPQYFMASAYLADAVTMSPLCTAFDTPIYTRDMQELLNSTVNDYDPDLVLNLDEDLSTNFMVYNTTVIVLEPQTGVNTVTGADHNSLTYTIENADATVLSLKIGDILAYPYDDEDILLLKVGAITANGSTVTISGTDVELEEIFSHIKIETASQGAEAIVDDSTSDDSVSFEGFDDGTTYARRAVEGSGSKNRKICFSIGADGPLSASIALAFDINFDYYLTLRKHHVQFTNDITLTAGLKITAKFERGVKLGQIHLPIIPGIISVGFEPEFKVEAALELEISATVTSRVGFRYAKGEGFTNLNTSPTLSLNDATLEGSIFIGLDLSPEIRVLTGVMDIGLSAQIGVFITAKHDPSEVSEDGSYYHNCEECYRVTVSFGLELAVKLELLWNLIKVSSDPWELKTPERDLFYISMDNHTIGFGSCPNRNYRLTVSVAMTTPIENATVTVTDSHETVHFGQTDSLGLTIFYLPAGSFSATATKDDLHGNTNSSISNKPAKLSIDMDYGGQLGDHCTWTLTKNGHLTIKGGVMPDYASSADPSYSKYKDQIKTITVSVSHIGANAFAGYKHISFIDLGFGNLTIGTNAFSDCTGITTINAYNSNYSGVQSIGANAFANCTALTNAHFLTKTTDIGASAFSGCTSMTSVTFPSCIKSVGSGAFTGCIALNRVTTKDLNSWCHINFADPTANPLYYAKELFHGNFAVTNLSGIYRVQTIADYAFYNYGGFSVLTLPSSITAIGNSAFANCANLTEINFPKSLVSIGEEAFANCANLNKAVFALGAPGIGNLAFKDVTATMYYLDYDKSWTSANKLNYGGAITWVPYKVTIASGTCGNNLTWLLNDENELIISGTGPMKAYDSSSNTAPWANYKDRIKTVIIEDGVTSIGKSAFYECYKITSVQIPDSVVEIEGCAFWKCSALTEITLPKNLTSIKYRLFQGCDKLAAITIPEGVTEIEWYAFLGCENLTSITIPASVKTIGDAAFGYSEIPYTRNVYITDLAAWCTLDFASYDANPLNGNASNLYLNGNLITELVIPTEVENVSDYAFYSSSITSVVAQEGVTAIGTKAFYNCPNLNKLDLADTVTTIGTSAFIYCHALTDLDLNQVNQIGNYAFSYCYNIGSINIGAQNTSIGKEAFRGCSSLSAISCSGSVASVGNHAFCELPLETITIIGNGTAILESHSFYNCASLNTITLSGISSIESNAFSLANGLPYGRNLYIDDLAMWCATDLADETASPLGRMGNLYVDGVLVNTLNIPASVDEIKPFTFYYCANITEVMLPSTVHSVDGSAFAFCVNLSRFTVSNDNKALCSDAAGVLYNADQTVLIKAPTKLSGTYTLPDSTETIGDYAFAASKISALVCYSYNLEEIGNYAFIDCTALASYRSYKPNSAIFTNVKVIGGYAFSGCIMLSEFPMMNAIEQIGIRAFSSTDLTKVYFEDTLSYISDYAFENCTFLKTITFYGSAPTFGKEPFYRVTATVNYPGDDSWSCAGLSFGGNLTWNNTSTYSASGVTASYNGHMTAKGGNAPTVSIASFTGLVADGKYLFLAVINPDATDLLAAENLLFVDQGTASADGTLTFRYIPRIETECVALVFGGAKKDLHSAIITSPAIDYNGQTHIVSPIVTYDGETLTEGEDYIVSGTVTFTKPGIYLCYITGMGQYTGEVEFAYGDLSAALSATNSYITLPCDMVADVTVSTNAYLDLNGNNLIGDIAISDGVTLSVFDTATAGYTAANRGRIIGSVQGNLARSLNTPIASYGHNYKYLALEEQKDVWSFHRYYLSVKSVVLSPFTKDGSAVNYKTVLRCNALVAENIESFGAKLTGDNTLYVKYYSPSAESWNEHTTQLGGIMKTGNSTAQNNANSRCDTTVSAYLTLSDGTELCSTPVTRSLRDMVSLANKAVLTPIQELALGKMYDTFKPVMDQWINLDISNIKDYASSNFNTDPTVKLPLQYVIGDKGVTITGYDGEVIDLEIPAEIDAMPVIDIGENAFAQQSTLRYVSIPATVTAISQNAFAGCTGLKDICIDPANTAFVTDEAGVLYNADMTTLLLAPGSMNDSYAIPESVAAIADYAFNACAALKELEIPTSVKSIGNNALVGCNALSSVVYAGSRSDWNAVVKGSGWDAGCSFELTYLNNAAFSEGLAYIASGSGYAVSGIGTCTDTEIVIPDTYNGLPVNAIESNAFQNQNALTRITIPDTVTTIGSHAFFGCSNLTAVNIPNGIRQINVYTFYGCSSLTEITLPSTVKTIGGCAFYGCSSLTEITLPSTVAFIGGYTFCGCSSLTEITLPSTVKAIAASTFRNCSALTAITIPATVTTIGAYAFGNCSTLATIIFTGTQEQWNAISKDTSWDIGCSFELVACSEGLAYIASGNGYAVSGIGTCTDTEIVIPDTYNGLRVNAIASNAFQNQNALTRITIPDTVRTIGSNAFQGCSNLTAVNIPNGIKQINGFTFYDCSSLTEITLPSTVAFIGGYAFYGCSSLTEITLPSTVAFIGASAFRNCSALTAITIPAGVTVINSRTFSNCYSLTGITLPDGITSISGEAFSSCRSLKDINIPETVTSIGNQAFASCTSLTEIRLPQGVTSIDDYAFGWCHALENIIYNGTETQWSVIEKGAKWDYGTGYDIGGYNLIFNP